MYTINLVIFSCWKNKALVWILTGHFRKWPSMAKIPLLGQRDKSWLCLCFGCDPSLQLLELLPLFPTHFLTCKTPLLNHIFLQANIGFIDCRWSLSSANISVLDLVLFETLYHLTPCVIILADFLKHNHTQNTFVSPQHCYGLFNEHLFDVAIFPVMNNLKWSQPWSKKLCALPRTTLSRPSAFKP